MHVHRTEASLGDVCRGFKVGLGFRIAFKVLARAGIPVSNWIQLGGPPSFDVAVFGCQPLGVDLGWLGSIEVRAGVAACCSLEVRGGKRESAKSATGGVRLTARRRCARRTCMRARSGTRWMDDAGCAPGTIRITARRRCARRTCMRVRCLTHGNAIRDPQVSGASDNRTRARYHFYFSEHEFSI